MGRTSRTRDSPSLETRKREAPLLSKHQLEIALSKMLLLDSPDLSLEQYPVSPEVGAELLFMAGFEHTDIKDRRVTDLGTGTGRLAIGAALLGARKVRGIDLDSRSLGLAKKNAQTVGVNVEWVEADAQNISEPFDTVVMNPPYGTRNEHADSRFLQAAFQIAPVVYSIHKSSTRKYIQKFVKNNHRSVDAIRSMDLQLPHLFPFHQKKSRLVSVDIYRILSA